MIHIMGISWVYHDDHDVRVSFRVTRVTRVNSYSAFLHCGLSFPESFSMA